MKPNALRFSAAALACLGLSALTTHAVTFSLDAPSPSVPGLGFPDDLFIGPGPLFVGTPGVGPAGFEVDAISVGGGGDIIHFSVDRGAIGAPGTAVAFESGFGDEAADIYVTDLVTSPGFNTQLYDGDGIVAMPLTPGSPSPGLGLAEPFGDNVDAYEITSLLAGMPGMVYFSVDAATAGGAYLGASGADIWMSTIVPGYDSPVPALFAPAGALGLAPTDDIDALTMLPGGVVAFSLTPGSPTLGGIGASPADILTTSVGGLPTVSIPAGALGLLPTDDLNALDFVPEPGSLSLLAVAGLGLMRRRRRE